MISHLLLTSTYIKEKIMCNKRRIITISPGFYLNHEQSTEFTPALQKAVYWKLSATQVEVLVNGHAEYLVTVMRHEAAVRKGRTNLFLTLLWATPRQKLAQTVALRGR